MKRKPREPSSGAAENGWTGGAERARGGLSNTEEGPGRPDAQPGGAPRQLHGSTAPRLDPCSTRRSPFSGVLHVARAFRARSYDYVIVGAGSTGCVVAQRLSDRTDAAGERVAGARGPRSRRPTMERC